MSRHVVKRACRHYDMEIPHSEHRKLSMLQALKLCIKTRDLKEGKAIHAAAVDSGVSADIFLASSLVHMYGRCGSMAEAHGVFNTIRHPDVVSWSTLILGYADNGQGEVAIELFCTMARECRPNSQTIVAVLKACAWLSTVNIHAALEKALAIHSAAASSCGINVYAANTLVDLYGKCRCMVSAHRVFEAMHQRDTVTWNALILGYAENGEGDVALQLFSGMETQGYEPSALTFVAALKACRTASAPRDSVAALSRRAADKGCLQDVHVASALVDAYAKCGCMSQARAAFDGMRRPDVVAWNTLLLGYADNGEGDEALKLFTQMKQCGCNPDALSYVAALKACACASEKEVGEVVGGKVVKRRMLSKGKEVSGQAATDGYDTDHRVACTMISMYAKCGSLPDAFRVFDGTRNRDVAAWTSMILGCAENGEGSEALKLFAQMDCEPNALTYAAALKACGAVGAYEYGSSIHMDTIQHGFDYNPVVASALIDFYAKCSSMAQARDVFDRIPEKDVVTWNALLAGYGRHGNTDQVFHLFDRMREAQVAPNSVTLLCVLAACSHAGLVDKGMEYFNSMAAVYKVAPDVQHCNCVVDMLGRAGRLEAATEVARSMPVAVNRVTWNSLLGWCTMAGNAELGKLAFDSLLSLDKQNAAAYVSMANIHRRN